MGIYFAITAILHKMTHARLLKSFGKVDPEAIQFLIEDGYKFANGILSGDLDFTKCKGPDLTMEFEKEEGEFGNPERWVTVQAKEAGTTTKLPSGFSSETS